MRRVFIAYRCHDEHRARAHAYTRAWWTDHGFDVVEAEGPRVGSFNVSAAFNEAASAGGAWTTGLFTGADIILEDPAQATRAFDRAESSGALVHAAQTFSRLDRHATARVYDGSLVPTYEAGAPFKRRFHGMKVVTRHLWDEVGGYDEGFKGWGYEDAAFATACRVLSGEEHLPGYAVHLWHPQNPTRSNTAQVKRNHARSRRYDAATSRSQMRRLLVNLEGSNREGLRLPDEARRP